MKKGKKITFSILKNQLKMYTEYNKREKLLKNNNCDRRMGTEELS